MGGTFGSVGTALSALRYHQSVMDQASGNIANVSTEGYARRRIVGQSVGAPAVPALWSRYEGYGDGVRVGSLDRMVDPLLDARARREHSTQSYLDTRFDVLSRLEAALGEPAGDGVSSALGRFGAAWHDLANAPDSAAARTQVLATAAGVADSLAVQRRNLEGEEGDLRVALLADVDAVNALASDLASVNEAIHSAKLAGTDASSLLDSRDALALRLSELTGAKAVPNGDGGMDVTLGGVALVSGKQAGQLAVTGGVNPDGTGDGGPVQLSVTPPGGAATVVSVTGGKVGATAELLTTTLPGRRASLVSFAQELADAVNAAHQGGYDATGAAGQPLLGVDPAAPGGPLVVLVTDPQQVAASGVAGGPNRDGGNATAVASALAAPTASYQRAVAVVGSEVASAKRVAANQRVLTAQVDGARDQLGGVSLDEEMVTMMQAQRAYEAAARVMTTIDSMLDTLINRTGLVR